MLVRWLIILGLGAASLNAADHAAGHGMLLFGQKTLYLSHLPLFHAPHDYQIVLEASLDAPTLKALNDARAAAPAEKIWTVDPESFVLPTQVGAAKAFKADIYQGHFERGGTAVVRGAGFRIDSVVHFRKFRAGAKPEKGSYFTFGKAGEMFAAHTIQAAPDFDRIVSVSIQADGSLKELSEIYFESEELKH